MGLKFNPFTGTLDFAGASSGLAIGTTVITSGTNTRVLFDDNGVVGEDAGFTYVKATDSLTVGALYTGGAWPAGVGAVPLGVRLAADYNVYLNRSGSLNVLGIINDAGTAFQTFEIRSLTLSIYSGQGGGAGYGAIFAGTLDNTSPCLTLDNLVNAKSILVLNDNGSAVFTVADGGNVTGTGNFSMSNAVVKTLQTMSGSSATSNFFSVTGTLPSTLSATTAAVNFVITTAGSSSQAVIGLYNQLNSGFTGNGNTYGIFSDNQTSPGNSGRISVGVAGRAGAAGTGHPIGILGSVTSASSTAYAGLFTFVDINGATPTVGNSCALVCDNAAAATDIFRAQDNGTAVFTIADGGEITATQMLSLGVNATTLGKLKLFGNTSGDVTLQPSAVAGTATVLTLPASTDTIVGKATTDILTNKTMIATSNVVEEITTTASSATPTPTGGSLRNLFTITAQAAAAAFAAPSGTPANGNYLTIRILDNGTARALTWNAIYRGSTDLPLPTTTTLSKTMYMAFRYNSADSKWDYLAQNNGF